ncbi:MAG: bifunctional UDP-N-acetylglucosamine diphosphorylase/glucosamine-1-phosphate N-acetyltransferase GlmU [Gammaproteobacteria bacterium]|nr:bifunctional UDP-N-acetylglucosamine diphosphorylase/glucosamine-1-phosphate N-acetyltransferase GlmU [Gammaproteobacteria bacterium]
MDLSIVVLAAGQGTRMKSTLPKVMQTIAGKPMLAHVVDTAKSLAPKKIIIVYGHGKDILLKAFQDKELSWVEQAVQNGTGDAVAKALPALSANERVIILYGDVPLISKETLQRVLRETPSDALGLITVNTDNPHGLGRIVKDQQGNVIKIVEEKDASEVERAIKEVNTGIFIVPSQYLSKWIPLLNNNNQQNEYYLTDIVALAVEAKVTVVTHSPDDKHEILGINDRAQQANIERIYQQQIAKKLLHQGVMISDPHRIDVRGTLQAQSDVFIDINVLFQGNVVLGKGCHIGPNCVLINCELAENVTILANSYIENTKIGNNVQIGPFARLRPGTLLKDDAKIGNFVEVKNATIGKGSKISHLSYIGDALVGEDVNIGAGTITCNYDGANKHQTIIEDDVMIGSDTQLIAPIRVGKGATIGAGSTLNKDVPANQLTVTQQLNQRSKAWDRPQKTPKQ